MLNFIIPLIGVGLILFSIFGVYSYQSKGPKSNEP